MGLANHQKKPWNTGLVLGTKLFWGSMDWLGGCILGWFSSVWPLIVAALWTHCPHGARAVQVTPRGGGVGGSPALADPAPCPQQKKIPPGKNEY